MPKLVFKERVLGGYRYIVCECGNHIQLSKPRETKVLYCSECNKIALDASQKYCCWCGSKFDEDIQG